MIAHVPVINAKDLPGSVRNGLITLDEFGKGLEVAVGAMTRERRSRFTRNVDLFGDAAQDSNVKMDASSPLDALGGMLEDKDPDEVPEGHVKIEINMDFAREAVNRSHARQLARKLPKSLVNLRNVIPPSHVKRIISVDGMGEEFGGTRIWCCKKCAMKFNDTANEVFEWSDDIQLKKQGFKVQKKLDNLRHLKKESFSLPSHTYPVGELPALCTPRMYQALHHHTSRSYTVGPPQFTPGGVKDLLGEPSRIREKTKFRMPRLPQLDRLPVERSESKHDADMSDLLDRLGLTPRRPVKGNFGSNYKPQKGMKGAGLDLAERNTFAKQGVARKILDPNQGNAFDWLENSLLDVNSSV